MLDPSFGVETLDLSTISLLAFLTTLLANRGVAPAAGKLLRSLSISVLSCELFNAGIVFDTGIDDIDFCACDVERERGRTVEYQDGLGSFSADMLGLVSSTSKGGFWIGVEGKGVAESPPDSVEFVVAAFELSIDSDLIEPGLLLKPNQELRGFGTG